MPQNNYVEDAIKRNGRRLNHLTKITKKSRRLVNKKCMLAKKLHGFKAIQFAKKCKLEKLQKKREIKKKEKVNLVSNENTGEALPHYLLDRGIQSKPKEIVKNVEEKLNTKAKKYSVPIPNVKGVSEAEAFKSLTTGKKKACKWKRMVTKAVFVGEDFTRKNPKYERFIRPMSLRFKEANIVNPENRETNKLKILSVKKNPHSDLYTNLGLLTKGTIIEVNVSDLGLVSSAGKIIWGKYAQVTNHPENDGCVNAILLV